eukprot:COSAG01_NODE_3631_length_5847_cov_18.156228_5_plen_406_part_00
MTERGRGKGEGEAAPLTDLWSCSPACRLNDSLQYWGETEFAPSDRGETVDAADASPPSHAPTASFLVEGGGGGSAAAPEPEPEPAATGGLSRVGVSSTGGEGARLAAAATATTDGQHPRGSQTGMANGQPQTAAASAVAQTAAASAVAAAATSTSSSSSSSTETSTHRHRSSIDMASASRNKGKSISQLTKQLPLTDPSSAGGGPGRGGSGGRGRRRPRQLHVPEALLPSLQQLHRMFPKISITAIAEDLMKTNNNIQRTIENILNGLESEIPVRMFRYKVYTPCEAVAQAAADRPGGRATVTGGVTGQPHGRGPAGGVPCGAAAADGLAGAPALAAKQPPRRYPRCTSFTFRRLLFRAQPGRRECARGDLHFVARSCRSFAARDCQASGGGSVIHRAAELVRML